MDAIVRDSDTDLLETDHPGPSWNKAYDDVERPLTVGGFTRMQGSTYFGDDSVDAARCARGVQRLAKTYPRSTPSIRDIGAPRIEENNDLRIALDDDDD